MSTADIKRLTSSWTKYDAVKVVQYTIEGPLNRAIKGEIPLHEVPIDIPVMRNFLGIDSLDDPIPDYWRGMMEHPRQLPLFALMAAIFTHYKIIELFAGFFSQGNMSGLLRNYPDLASKEFTNLRSALVESEAADSIFRRKPEVPYDLGLLFESGDAGILMKDLLERRLQIAGYVIEDDFYRIAGELQFAAAFSLTEQQFLDWTRGKGISNSLLELRRNRVTSEHFGRIRALKVHQWLHDWDRIPDFNGKNRQKPQPFFYQFNIPALLLKRIYEIHSRQAIVGRENESNIQRRHNKERSNEIREFVSGGYPWSTISKDQRENESFRNLQMPGWLPTSIIANILKPGSERKQRAIGEDEVIRIEEVDDRFADIILPEKIWSEDWTPAVAPIEIIDGQHRIKAFDYIRELEGNFELPVIAFHDLDFTWQAYLFYTINIKPKRINTSLAFDLMPLLRIQDWLEHDLNGPDIYRKVRAQELTELLWSTPVSPWYNRINMLGDTGAARGGPVSQNAFINSLISSFVKRWDGRIGGLFGGELHAGEQDVIQWDKETQAAYLIVIWKAVNSAISRSKAEWVQVLKGRPEEAKRQGDLTVPFLHPQSFFATDQGIRPVLWVFNDMSFEANDLVGLNKFSLDIDFEQFTTAGAIEHIVTALWNNSLINEFVHAIAIEIVNNFDWRTPTAFDAGNPVEDLKRQHQNQFRGSGGYREMRLQLMRILAASEKVIGTGETAIDIGGIARVVQEKLGL